MIYLLDTNACISYLNDAGSAVRRRMASLSPGAIVVCDIVKAELYFGAYKGARTEANLALLSVLFAQFSSLPFDGAAAEVCGRLRAELAAAGTPVGPYDLQIAAIALAHGLVLVTHNVREFARVPGLQVEDWQS